MSSMSNGSTLADAAKQELADAAQFVLFDDSGTILASNYQPEQEELQALARLLDDRDAAMRSGLRIAGQRYEVHRFHPPLAYGRSMGCEPERSVGAALCRVENGITGRPCFGAITYEMPQLSARMVPLLQQLCEVHLCK